MSLKVELEQLYDQSGTVRTDRGIDRLRVRLAAVQSRIASTQQPALSRLADAVSVRLDAARENRADQEDRLRLKWAY